MVARRQDLVAALSACTDSSFRAKARRFLAGLSADELQFIAEYLGCCILESPERHRCSRAQLAARIAEFHQCREAGGETGPTDQDHKMILLLEYLCRSGLQQPPMPMRAGRAY
jgi:hypothetical protein